MLNHKKIVAMKKALKADWDKAVAARRDELDKEVAQVRTGNGKFGIRFVTQDNDQGSSVGVVPTYEDPKTKDFKTI